MADGLDGEIVGSLILAKLDTFGATLRFILNEEGVYTDANGDKWLGSKMVSSSDIQSSIGGIAPTVTLAFTYTLDESTTDLITEIMDYGLTSVRHRPCVIYEQTMTSFEDFYRPTLEPVELFSGDMMNLSYSIDGPQTRQVSVTVEGPMNLRSKPVNGLYSDTDQKRRFPDDKSLELMPNNSFDEEPLFGL